MAKVKDSDRILHDRLRLANERNLLLIFIDPKILGAARSPVFNPWESVVPLLGLLLLGLFMLLAAGMIVGTVVLVLAVLVQVFVVRSWAEQRLRRRVTLHVLHSATELDRLWSQGGLMLAMADRPDVGVASPNGNWRSFVNRYLPAAKPKDSLGAELSSAGFEPIPGRRSDDPVED